jgi:hypothetical protein
VGVTFFAALLPQTAAPVSVSVTAVDAGGGVLE